MLRVSELEIRFVNSAAAEFIAGDESLRAEAIGYHRQTTQRGVAPDRQIVHSFTERRAALAVAAMDRVRKQLPSEKYAALERFINQDFAMSVHVVAPGRAQ